jgi:glycosyltransferase involved in cell wall biosynthesis
MCSRGLDPAKFTWIPNGFSQDEVNKNILLNPQVIKQIPDKKFLIGYTGTMGLANSLSTLIEAAEKLKDHTDIAFVLVGSGKEKLSLKSLVEQKGLGNIFFIEPIPKVEIPAILERFDVCYIGWRNEPMYQYGIAANKIFDYLCSGKPVIHSYSGACDPISEVSAGLLVPAQDSDKLAKAILKLYLMTPSERTKLGENGRKAAIQQYEYNLLSLKLERVLFDT